MRTKAILWLAIFVCVMAMANVASAIIVQGIDIDFVTIGNAGNPGDIRVEANPTGCGAVGYEYRIGKYEVTNAQWNAFTAVAGVPTGTDGGYDRNAYWTGKQQPTNILSWFEAAQFCNYLTSGDKSQGVYQFSGDNTNPGAFVDIDRATAQATYGSIYFLPTEDEWYKAAYYKPDGSGYSTYANGTDVAPVAGVETNYGQDIPPDGPWDIGTGTIEQNGTFDMMGNVWEWNEVITATSGFSRGVRGGSYRHYDYHLASSYRGDATPGTQNGSTGFRVGCIILTEPPIADSDGPYTVYVGDGLTLDASGSTDPDNDIVSYLWDLDDDEVFETDAGGQAIFAVDYAYLESLELLVNYEYTVSLKVTDSEGQSDTADSTLVILPKPAVQVAVDIKPGGCPNPVNTKSSGVLPVAILGSDDYDVTAIDPTSIRLSGVEPLRSGYEDVGAPLADANDCECTELGPDGLIDLTLKFETQKIVEALGEVEHGDMRELALTGILYDPAPYETPIEGAGCILIKGKHKPTNKADINEDGLVNMVDILLIAENWLESSVTE